MDNGFSTANIVLWICAVFLVGFTVVQAALFLRIALRFNRTHKIYTRSELMSAARTGAVASLGPGVNTVFLALALISMFGGGFTFMRCGIIGSPMYELMVVQYSSSFAGYTPGDPMTGSLLAYFCFAALIGTISYLIAPVFTLRILETAGTKQTGKPNIVVRVLPQVGITVLLLMCYDFIRSGLPQAIGLIAAFALTLFCSMLAKKGQKWLNSWTLFFATVVGITVAQIISMRISS